MRRVLFLLSSARPAGNALTLARAAAAGLDATAVWFDLTDPPLPPFADPRPAPCPAPAGRLAALLEETLAATDLVLVAPVYWYALPAPAKLMLDHWSGWLDLPGAGFQPAMAGKRMWLITARADPDPTVTDPVEAMLRRSAAWMGMAWGGALHGVGDGAGEVRADAAAMARAAQFLRGAAP